MRFPLTASLSRCLGTALLTTLAALPLTLHAQAGAACDPASTAAASRNACAGRTARCKAATRDSETRPEGPRLYHECLTAATQERMQALERWLQP
jgi:uncharacterized protein YecT (DUF1311 family)